MANTSLEPAQRSSLNITSAPPATERHDDEQPASSASTIPDSSTVQEQNIIVAKLQELIDVSKAILKSNEQIADVEKNQDGVELVSPIETSQEDRERGIWAAVVPHEIQTIEVMTPEELAANPSWDEKMLEKAERLCPKIFESWEDIWTDLYGLSNSELNLWLQKRLMVLCCSIDEEDDGGWIYRDQRSNEDRKICERQHDEWETRFQARLESALLASTSYVRHVGREIVDSLMSWDEFETFSKIMITFLVVNYTSEVAEVTIGHVLEKCYLRRTLTQPAADRKELYLEHILLVISVARTLNITWCCSSLEAWQGRSVESVMGLPLANILQIERFEYSPGPLKTAEGTTFSTIDLKVSMLRSIGHLELQWTDRHERHLLLDPSRKTLEICWFSAPVGEPSSAVRTWFKTSSVTPLLGAKKFEMYTPSELLEGELVQTWALLFSSSRSARGRRKSYASLPEPYWLTNSTTKTMSRWLNPEDMNKYTEIRSHLNDFPDMASRGFYARWYDDIIESALRRESLQYSSFPIYEKRLRELRAYMDSSKPQGLRQLFRDNRDSLTYYTFWGVIVFGTLSVVLAVFSLAATVAQTVAGYRALPPGH